MRRWCTVVGASIALVAGLLAAAPAGASPAPTPDQGGLDVYRGTVAREDVAKVVDLGVDRHEIEVTPSATPGDVDVEVILSATQADVLSEQGVDLQPKLVDGATVAERASTLDAQDEGVFRPYSGPGGLAEEMQQQADAHPRIAELQVIGQTVQGQDIVAVKVTRNARRLRDGIKPATVYVGAQHAREWITPEMVRRLLDRVLTAYGTDPQITDLVNRTELWFVPVANPDGYDYTFQPGQRLWRKNLADNNGNGVVDDGDGVDPNRNYPTRWGYDNEGSSPDPTSDIYRGPAPGSEPETKALDGLFARITPQFFVNYHSAAQLLLYDTGWQVATPTPDDVLYEAMAGDDAHPAIPGYDPDVSAELYTTNGEVTEHMQEAYGTLSFTVEMSTCATVSAAHPDDQWDPADCGSDFEFPDDEALIEEEFEKNVPFALAAARSAPDPDDPVSVVGRTAEDFRVDAFDVSYGDPQTVATYAKRALNNVRLNYRVNGGRLQRADVAEWTGGERYGAEHNDYYAELRGQVTGTHRGDTVEVWFTGRKPGTGPVESEHFTYTVERDSGNRALVIANEDYTGVNPTYPPSVTGPKYLNQHLAALVANGVGADSWDVDAQGVPRDLGVLSHYDVVLWYLGDNRLTQDPEDALTDYFGAQLPDLAVAERQQYLTMAVRDFLNQGGKLIYAGETAGYYGIGASAFGGIWYGLDGALDQDCVVTADPYSDCLLLADDFTQYYLGAWSRAPIESAAGVVGTVDPITGEAVQFGGTLAAANPVDEAGAFRPTSDVLPVEQFPQFASEGVAEYVDPTGTFIPVEGRYGAGVEHADNSHARLARTFDLSNVTAADTPTFAAQFSYDTEPGYDNVIVEAHTVGQDNWTTLPDVGGATSTDVPAECEAGFLLGEHPWLAHYLTLDDECTATGTTGTWNSFTGSSDGWIPVAFDLSAYAGQRVEIVISYVSDPFTGGAGLIVDDTRLVTNAGTVDAEGFETGFGPWAALGPPAGSPPSSTGFERSTGLGGIIAATVTDDTVLLGFGLEQLVSLDQRVLVVGAALDHLGVAPAVRRAPSDGSVLAA